MTPAVCLDPAKAQKKPNQTPNLLRNHEQRRASAGKLCLGRYPASHTRLVQRIPSTVAPAHMAINCPKSLSLLSSRILALL
jgi:hypothetical protein